MKILFKFKILSKIIKYPPNKIKAILKVIRSNFKAEFPFELNESISLPKNISSFGIEEACIVERFQKEILLRLIAKFIIAKNKSIDNFDIIDIGAWVGDNAIVWAKLSGKNGGKVFAIDPSLRNINWIKKVAKRNSINNLIAIQALASNKEKISYKVDSGKSQHSNFKKSLSEEGKYLESITLDSIVRNHGFNKLLLLHLDVEGMEIDVLKGAKRIITESRCFIFFENHIVREDKQLNQIIKFLNKLDYSVSIVNEVLGAYGDTRNFLAIHKSNSIFYDLINKNIKIDAIKSSSFSPLIPKKNALININ